MIVILLAIVIDVSQLVRHLHEVFIVVIDKDGQLVLKQIVIQLAFCLANTLEGAEALQVGTSYVGDESAGGFGRLYQRLDVARVRGSHLYDGNVVVVVQSEQRLRHTYIVVEVALGSHHVIALREYGTNQLLRSRLAVRACNADDGDVELATMLTSQILEGLQAVVNSN